MLWTSKGVCVSTDLVSTCFIAELVGPGLGRIGHSFVVCWYCPPFFPEFFFTLGIIGIVGLTTTRVTAVAGTGGFELEAETNVKSIRDRTLAFNNLIHV